MSFFGKLVEAGREKLGEIEQYKMQASCMSNQELLRKARSASGTAKHVYLQEVKNRGLGSEYTKMMKS